MKFHTPSFLLGAVLGIVATFAVLNGGACRPSPTPTDDGEPVPVSVPKPADDKPIAAPVAPVVAPVEVPVEVPEVKAAEVPPAKIEVVVAAPVSGVVKP